MVARCCWPVLSLPFWQKSQCFTVPESIMNSVRNPSSPPLRRSILRAYSQKVQCAASAVFLPVIHPVTLLHIQVVASHTKSCTAYTAWVFHVPHFFRCCQCVRGRTHAKWEGARFCRFFLYENRKVTDTLSERRAGYQALTNVRFSPRVCKKIVLALFAWSDN